MQVELIGCTSAGKTTLARRLVEVGKELGIDVQLSDDFLLRCIRLNWIKNEFVRRRIIELWALLVCLVFLRKYHELNKLIIRICCSVPGSWIYRLKLLRVVLRKIGIYEVIRSRSSDQQVVLLDNEGILQASHTLFVHPTGALYTRNLTDFLDLIPLSDVIAYLRQPEPVLIERTERRGHNRISDGANHEDIEPFITQAVGMFEEIRLYPRFSDRLFVIDGERNALLTNEHLNNRPVDNRPVDNRSAEKLAMLIIAEIAKIFPFPFPENRPNAGNCSASRSQYQADFNEIASESMRRTDLPRILYIASYSRSGSTLLDIVLGGSYRTAAVGEISFIGADWSDDRLRCSCGEPYRSCPVWHDLFASSSEAIEAHKIVRSVERASALASIVQGNLGSELGTAYREIMQRTFSHASARLDADLIVDSSKSARATVGRFLALSRYAGFDVRVLHFVRSARATADSYAAHGSNWVREGRIPPYLAVVPRSMIGWRIAHEKIIHLLKLVDPEKQMRIRYEDLVLDPEGVITAIGAFSGIDVIPAVDKLRHGESHTVGHLVGGNRMRHQKTILIKPSVDSDSDRLSLLEHSIYRLLVASLDKKFGY